MKKRVMSTRIGAVLLAASMVVGDAVPTLAAQNTGIETHVSEAEMLGTGVSGTETAETQTSETETADANAGTDKDNEAAVAGMGVNESSETAGENETKVPENKVSETEETGNTETTGNTEMTENTETTETETAEETETTETEAAEETETTETETVEETEITDTEEITEDDVVLGDEVGVSTVIGLEGEEATDYTFSSEDGTVEKVFSYVNKKMDNESEITVSGTKEEWKDAATGLYQYNGSYYSLGYNYSDGSCRLYGKVAKVLTEAPQKDTATGLYVVDGKYYPSFNWMVDSEGNRLCYIVQVTSEVEPLGTISVANGQSSYDILKETYGKKIADTDTAIKYYEVNGRDFTALYTTSISKGTYIVYGYKNREISFTRHHQAVRWKPVTNPTEISSNGKMYYIGYQVRMNGVDQKLTYETIDGQNFASRNYFSTADVFAAGEQNVYEVRAVYYTKTRTATKNSEGVVTYRTDYAIAKKGDWSEAYAYANEGEAEKQLQEVPAVTNLTVTKKKNNYIELNWDEVPAASKYYIYQISSDTALATISEKDWKNGSCRVISAEKNYDTGRLNKKYNYYRVAAWISYENDTYKAGEGKASNIVSVEADEVSSEAVTVTGFRAEAQTNGAYRLKWDELPSSTSVSIYYTADQSALSNNNYLLGLIDAEGTYLYDAANNTAKTVFYTDDEKVKEAYDIARKKVSKEGVHTGNSGIGDGILVNVPAGKTYYFVAVTVSEKNYNTDRSAVTPYVGSRLNNKKQEVAVKYGNYNDVAVSTIISATGVLKKPDVPSTKSEKTSITMTFNKQSGVTGYEIYKKNNKGKYKKIATTTSARYVDKNLKEGTTCSYRARAYVYNTATKKKTYSDYVAFSAETSISNYIDVTVAMAGKNAVKVKWTKVAGATKYEIYRSSTESIDDVYSSSNKYGLKNNEKWKLVKTIGKAKTVSYTDKKLNAGETYTYAVMAYYKSGKETKTINDAAAITLQVTTPANVKAVLSRSKVKVSWDKNSYAKKYEVRYTRYDSCGKPYTEEPVVVTTKKTAVTISGLKTGDYVGNVRVRAYDGKKWSDWSNTANSDIVSLAAVRSVSAKNITVKDARGKAKTKVQVSWKAVSGAAYYKVYRSTSPAVRYDKDNKAYDGLIDAVSIVKEGNMDESNYYNTVDYDDYKGQSGTITGTKAIDGGALQTGVTYYYFVAAYSENGKVQSVGYANRGSAVTFGATPGIKSAKAKGGKVTVSINKVAGAKKYVIYRSTKKNKGFVAVGTTKKTSYVDKKVKKGKTYYYKVVAIGTNALQADFETGMSSAVKVKAK